MFWILFRNPADHRTPSEMVLFETDDWTEAFHTLRGAAVSPGTELIDFSGNLDGDLDFLLAGVKLFDTLPVAA
jgi:hypothetical protein